MNDVCIVNIYYFNYRIVVITLFKDVDMRYLTYTFYYYEMAMKLFYHNYLYCIVCCITIVCIIINNVIYLRSVNM